jgi:endopeptidase La
MSSPPPKTDHADKSQQKSKHETFKLQYIVYQQMLDKMIETPQMTVESMVSYVKGINERRCDNEIASKVVKRNSELSISTITDGIVTSMLEKPLSSSQLREWILTKQDETIEFMLKSNPFETLSSKLLSSDFAQDADDVYDTFDDNAEDDNVYDDNAMPELAAYEPMDETADHTTDHATDQTSDETSDHTSDETADHTSGPKTNKPSDETSNDADKTKSAKTTTSTNKADSANVAKSATDESAEGDSFSSMPIDVFFSSGGGIPIIKLYGNGSAKGDTRTPNSRKFQSLLNSETMKEQDTIKYFDGISKEDQAAYISELEAIQHKYVDSASNKSKTVSKSANMPLILRVLGSNLNATSKRTIIERVNTHNQSKNQLSGGEYKHKEWISSVAQIPFDSFAAPQCTESDSTRNIRRYLKSCRQKMANSMYGHERSKDQIMRIVAQLVGAQHAGAQNVGADSTNVRIAGNVIAIEGPPGVGKTALIRRGLCAALGRPFAAISLGGATDAAFLEGHDFTYQGARFGQIVEILMETGVMNPVIYFDELDKVSQTPKGEEIINCLMHLIDPTQNTHFRDKYFSGIDLDLSGAIFIFSLNSTANVNPILLDRMKVIRTQSYVTWEKIEIVRSHLMSEIERETNIAPNTVAIGDDVLRFMIESYTNEGGVRRLKELITEVLMELRLRSLEGSTVIDTIENIENNATDTAVRKEVTIPRFRGNSASRTTKPFEVTKGMLVGDIFNKRTKIHRLSIHAEPVVGVVNGLWANQLGTGGLIPIQARKIDYSDSATAATPVSNTSKSKSTNATSGSNAAAAQFVLRCTGMQGEVMKESMEVSKSVALGYMRQHHPEFPIPSGVHIHCPDGATPKDGPSAGAAITSTILSLLMNRKTDPTLAMTGEIDLLGRVTAIGGLQEKVFGAIRANVKRVLYPKENQADIDRMRERHSRSLIDIELIPIGHIDDVLKWVFV